MIEKDPDAVVCTHSSTGSPGADLLGRLASSATWGATTAVRRGDVVIMDDDILTLPGPRMVDGLEQLAALVAKVAAREPAE